MPAPLLAGLSTLMFGQAPHFELAVSGLASVMQAGGWTRVFVPFAGQWQQTKYPFEPFQSQIFRAISVDGGLTGVIISKMEEEVYIPGDWELVNFPFPLTNVDNEATYWEKIRGFYVDQINALGGVDGKWHVKNEQIIFEDDYQVQSIWEYVNDDDPESLTVPDASGFIMGAALRQLFGGPQRGGFAMTSDWIDNSGNRIALFLAYPDAPVVSNSFPSWYATSAGLARMPHPGFFKPADSSAKFRMPGMVDTHIYANPYTIWADAIAQGSDGTTNHLSAGVLHLFGSGSRAGYASTLSNFHVSKHADLQAIIKNDTFYNQDHGCTLDMVFPRVFRLNTETDTKKWPDGSIQVSEIPIVHRVTEFPDYFLGGYLPHILIAHSTYNEGDIVLFDGRRYVAFGNGPNTLMCEIPAVIP